MNNLFESDYRIGEDTFVLMNCDRPHAAKVIDKGGISYVDKMPLDLIKESCLRDGLASYEGKRAAVKYKMKYKYKIPIPVIPHLDLFFFPTHGVFNVHNIWINPDKIKHCVADKSSGTSIVRLNNDIEIEVQLQHDTLHNLYIEAIRCQHVFGGNDRFDFT